jgi:aldose 1-epimerase
LQNHAIFIALAILAAWLIGLPNLASPAQADETPNKGDVTRHGFGKTPEGEAVDLFVLTRGALTAKVITYGAIVTEIHAPDRDGKAADVVLGFDTLEGYLAGHPYFGATVGRVANRIAGGRFTLDGRDYALDKNNGPNTLHGGKKGFDKVVWKAEESIGPAGPAVRLTYTSPDGEEGFPGNLTVAVTYTLTERDALRIDYEARSDRPTPVNLTNHSYFNLAGVGPGAGTILDHVLYLASVAYTPADDTLIPTGEIAPVRGTPLDFTTPTPLGARIDQLKAEPRGYDHNFVLAGDGSGSGAEKTATLAARVQDPNSGRTLEMFTTEPGVQLYTGNFLDGSIKGKGGVAYRQHQAFCLEAQHFPDSVHRPEFPSTILRPGSTYTQTTLYRFSGR